jgi:2-phospho-L-lactate guanylyltransferase
METWAIIPVKSLAQTKSRLTAVLSPSERADLTLFMLERTIGVLQAAGIGKLVVVSRDTAVTHLATQHGALTLAEPPGAGLNEAIQEGVRLATLGHADRVLVLPADLPFLTADDVTLVCQDSTCHTITICPDRHEQGTNGLLLPLPTNFAFQFGEGSFQKHVMNARYGRLTPHLIRTPGWQFDLDTVEDWDIYAETVQ